MFNFDLQLFAHKKKGQVRHVTVATANRNG